ncbi:MAG TPA: Rieske 2Fe-2S domain-containing protein [Thermomicrobiales bacterium]|nr:Rieske 2Fe-2S domain-containing protein [Thermomicrobiales bacterium]
MVSIRTLADRLVDASPWLDKVAGVAHAASTPVFGEKGPPALKDALYGTWLGHPLHPAVTDLPIGFWTSSAVFDAVGMEDAADFALKAGTVSAFAAAVTGIAQWYDLQHQDQPRRLGTLHGVLNIGATWLYGTSWFLRSHQHRGAGIAFSLAGGSVATLAASLGGDLSYRLGTGVSRTAFEEPTGKWAPAIAVADLPEATPTRVVVEGDPVVLVRQGERVLAASATCTHLGGPLDEGELKDGCLTCPWHGSVFALADGHVVNGPATSPLTTYATRVRDGQIEVIAAAERAHAA